MPVTLLGVEIVRTWGAPFEAQGKAVLRPLHNLADDTTWAITLGLLGSPGARGLTDGRRRGGWCWWR